MISRRSLLGGILAVPALHLPEIPHAPSTRPPASGETKAGRLCGIMALDDVMGRLHPGELICLAGRPCVGKTQLLLQLALQIRSSWQQNVLFVTLREPPEVVATLAPTEDRSYLRVNNEFCRDIWMHSPTSGREPHVCISRVSDVDLADLARIGLHMRNHHSWGCGLIIVDGWTSDPRVSRRDNDLRIFPTDLLAMNFLQPPAWNPALMTAQHVATLKRTAASSGIPIVVGIQSGWNDYLQQGPKPADLLDIRDPVASLATQTVWMHRPELYWRDARRHHLRGVTRLFAEQSPFGGPSPVKSTLRFRVRERHFLTVHNMGFLAARDYINSERPPEAIDAIPDDLG